MDANDRDEEQAPTIAARLFRSGLRLFVACVATVVALAFLSFFGRLWWPLELLSHFRVQYVLILAAAAPVLWLAGRWRLSLAAGALVLVSLVGIAPYYLAPAARPAATNNSVRVMVMNVRASNRQADRVVQAVQDLSPDVVVVIEVTPWWCEQLQTLQREFPHGTCEARTGGAGIGVYSRLPLRDLNVELIGGTNAPAITANLATPAGEVSLIAAHPVSPMGSWRWNLRNRQLKDLADLTRRRQPHPVVVVGDLNVTPWSPFFGDLLRNGQLGDARRGRGIQPTWPQPFGLSALQIPIDHCLVGEGVAVGNFQRGPPVGSDHLPIVVDLARTRAAE